jgi:predicted dehydrogenase
VKILVVGLGSMGSRRVRDLKAAGHTITGFDCREDRRSKANLNFNIQTIDSKDSIQPGAYDAMVISTPPDQHEFYYKLAHSLKLPFFSEANILTPKPSFFEESGVNSFPSATWRFHPIFQQLKQLISEIGIESLNVCHYQFGGYLPFWHPDDDPNQYYAFQPETNATREMVPFEFEWLAWAFGPIASVCAASSQTAFKEFNIPDAHLVHAKLESGHILSVNIELHQCKPFRKGVISFLNHNVTFDVERCEGWVFDRKEDTHRYLKPKDLKTLTTFDLERVYRAEIEAFAASVERKVPYVKTWKEDRHLSDILIAVEKSLVTKSWVNVSEVSNSYSGFWDGSDRFV